MKNNFKVCTILLFLVATFSITLNSCFNANSNAKITDSKLLPSQILQIINKSKIMLGNGEILTDLKNYKNSEFFYSKNDGKNWVVYKTPNAGTTSPNSSNTRTELHENNEWVPKTGGKLTGTLKVMHVSTTGDARVAASYSVVVGQIHSGSGHENEPFKLFYKKYPGHKKGSLFWNYEINTAGKDNGGRWDFSTAIWGYDMSVIGKTPNSYPAEPKDGIELGEEFSYEVNVHKGIMYLTFNRKGYPTKKFTKNLIKSEYTKAADMPKQVKGLFAPIGQDGVERRNAYAGELNYFKQGAYNQTNGKDPKKNMVWCTGSKTFGGDIPKQYENGSYAEVWFSEGSISASSLPKK